MSVSRGARGVRSRAHAVPAFSSSANRTLRAPQSHKTRAANHTRCALCSRSV